MNSRSLLVLSRVIIFSRARGPLTLVQQCLLKPCQVGVYLSQSLQEKIIPKFGSQQVLVCFSPRVKDPFGAMSLKIKLNTVEGSVITLDVLMTATVGELKSMLLEKHPCQDPIERKILGVELLHNSSIMKDAETIDGPEFLSDESLVTVVYTRNEVEAAALQHDICTQAEYFGVKIPSNVTNISDKAFKNLHQLVLLTIPGSVTHIGNGAFERCTSLASITLGESVTHIGHGAFERCTSLASITVGESVTHIGVNAFASCTSLASVTLGESVTHIGHGAFERCTSLASITLGDSVTHIGVNAFESCTSLASITMGESVTQIAVNAFAGCTSLASITLGESLTRIGQSAFAGCTSLASITWGESVTHIADWVFADCTSLVSTTLGESVAHIGKGAFEGCTALVSITLSESVTHIGANAFEGAPRWRASQCQRQWITFWMYSGTDSGTVPWQS